MGKIGSTGQYGYAFLKPPLEEREFPAEPTPSEASKNLSPTGEPLDKLRETFRRRKLPDSSLEAYLELDGRIAKWSAEFTALTNSSNRNSDSKESQKQISDQQKVIFDNLNAARKVQAEILLGPEEANQTIFDLMYF